MEEDVGLELNQPTNTFQCMKNLPKFNHKYTNYNMKECAQLQTNYTITQTKQELPNQSAFKCVRIKTHLMH